MNRRLRAALVAAVAAATLVAANGRARRQHRASVGITDRRRHESTTIHVSVPQTTDPIAAINIYVPAGYTANFSRQASGTNDRQRRRDGERRTTSA